jgi:malonate-semialdehyde dehydrogenase (acetylating)/methylmalonate-semialdehyde dehydrogenase
MDGGGRSLVQALKNYIDGAWAASSSAERTEVMNPLTGEPIAWCPTSTAAEVDDAIAAARRAFPGWSGTPVTKRAAALFELRQRLADATPEIAKIMEEENGKCYSEGVGENGQSTRVCRSTLPPSRRRLS